VVFFVVFFGGNRSRTLGLTLARQALEPLHQPQLFSVLKVIPPRSQENSLEIHPRSSLPPHHSSPFCTGGDRFHKTPRIWHLPSNSTWEVLPSVYRRCACGYSCLSSSLFRPFYHPLSGLHSNSDSRNEEFGGDKGRLEITIGRPEHAGTRDAPELLLPACAGARNPRPHRAVHCGR
jgi:hypothetical protein